MTQNKSLINNREREFLPDCRSIPDPYLQNVLLDRKRKVIGAFTANIVVSRSVLVSKNG